MQPHETASKLQSAVPAAKIKHPVKHRYRFTIVKDSRNRKVRGLWRRGEKLYLQTRVSGERSARKIPLKARSLEAAREEMADLKKLKRIEGLPETGLRPLFSDYADKYLEFHRTASDSGKKARTIDREEHSLVHWKAAIGNVRLDKITRPMVTSVIKSRLATGIKPRTVNIDVIVLRNVLNEAKEEERIARLPTEGIKPRKVKTPVRTLLTPAQFDELCKGAAECGKNHVQVTDYLRLLAYSGARRDEALALKWDDVNFERQFVQIGADGSAKNSKARYVDFNPELKAHLEEMATRRAPDSEWLFPSPQRGETDKPTKTFRDSFAAARNEAELPWVGFHDLRHYFASMAVMSGIDFKTIAEWLGHQDGGMLVGKVYGHLLPEHRQRMAERLVFSPSVVRLPDAQSSVSPSAPGRLETTAQKKMPGPLDEIALFPIRQHEERLRQREAAEAKILQERLAELKRILTRLKTCCKQGEFRWPEKRDLDRLHVLVLELVRRIRKRPPLPLWKCYKAVDRHWHLRLWQTLSVLVDRAAKNVPVRPLEPYNERFTCKPLTETVKNFFQCYDEVVKGRDPSQVKWEQFDELFSSVTGKTISRRIPLTEAKSATYREFMKLFCDDHQWVRKYWRGARALTVYVATQFQDPEMMRKLTRFLIPAHIGELTIEDVEKFPVRLLEEKQNARRTESGSAENSCADFAELFACFYRRSRVFADPLCSELAESDPNNLRMP